MANQHIAITPGSGSNIDVSELTVAAVTVERQRMNIADPTLDVGLAAVGNSTPTGTEYGLLMRQVGTAIIAGNVAAGAADSGNPVKAGGVYNTSPPTLSNAQRGDLQIDVNGNLKVNPRPLTATDLVSVQPVPGFIFPTTAALYDGFGNQIASYAPGGGSSNMIFASTVNVKALLSVAAGTVIAVGTVTSADIDVSHFSELAWDFKSTAGTGTITITINRKGVDGTYYPIYQSGSLATATTQSAQLGRGFPTAPTATTATGYGAFACSIGQTIQVVTVTATSTITCGYSLIAKM
jgi:hypothetical protein